MVDEKFAGGAVRQSRAGKGRFDLISPWAQLRVARVLEYGATIAGYGDRNWEKGMPMSRFLDSLLRHLNQWMQGETDEDHLAQARFNLDALLHFETQVVLGLHTPSFVERGYADAGPLSKGALFVGNPGGTKEMPPLHLIAGKLRQKEDQ
jgi:hypothetical protein